MLAQRHVLSMMLTTATMAGCSFDNARLEFPAARPPDMAVVSRRSAFCLP
jgi:hypothetical protein